MEKAAYPGDMSSNDSPTYDDSERESSSRIVEEKGIELGEAADMYGDLGSAEEYGYVTRGLKSRHIQFIALGGTIGTGLFLGIGRAFTQAGPLSLLLGYSFTGVAVYAMIMSLGEMATWLPLPGAIPQFCTRYVDGAMGFAVGAMKAYKGTGSTGRFLGLFSVLVNAAFSYGGVEFVAVAAGEAENPRYSIPKAVRRVFWRILFFYVLGSLAIGVLIPYNEPLLLSAIEDGAPGGAASPWVIAIYRAGVPVLPSIVNAVILTSASSSANAHLCIGSRYLYALAQSGQAPQFLLKCSKRGVPYFCVAITASISLTYMSCTSGAEIVFQWFQDIVAISTLITWMSVSIAYIGFHAALKTQGIDRRTFVFRSPIQPYTAYFSLCFFGMIAFFNGFHTFGPFNIYGFVTAYVGIPIYLALYAFWKIFKGTKLVKAHEADIHTGKAAMDAADAHWPPRVARNWVEGVWFWIA
ncbi:MAG: hypothetical protein L6R38_000602 [Xanthoria sp. 2 TBL-2021]|nr:MAG: hypothetical protein L6R38_000602 [Xanthoria sp. 2 TBL-2021]